MDKNLTRGPVISVIIPSFNGEKFLSETIESVLAQSFRDWECIIINNGSSDNTDGIAKKYSLTDPRISYFSQKNNGPGGARNAGLARAKGEFIQLLDHDDLLKPEKFAVQLEVFNKHPEADLIYSDFRFFNNRDTANLYSMKERYVISENPVDDFVFNWVKDFILPPHPILFRKSCFEKWGMYDEKLGVADDWDLYVRFAIHKPKIIFCDEVLALYRSHPDGITSEKNETELFNQKIKMYKKHARNMNLPERHRKHVKFLLHNLIGEKGFGKIKRKKYFEGIKYLLLASYYSLNPAFYFYHGIYWMKESLKRRAD